MAERPEVWLVARGEELVAELEVEWLDPPWFHGRAVRRTGFWPLQTLFDREQQLARRVHQNPAAWTTAYRRLRHEVRLLRPDGHAAPDFILHIDGNRARWRSFTRESTNWLDEQRAATPPVPATSERLVRHLLAGMLGAFVVAMALPGVALADRLHHRQTDNWAGYAVTSPQPFRSVSGSWVQPAATCDQATNTYAAFWVGIGGFKQDSQKLEQTGTESDCSIDGNATSYAWYELLPHPPVTIKLPVRPGDRIAAHVILNGDLVNFRIHNLTNHRTFVKTIPFAAPDTSSAEWIAEAPSDCNHQLCQPLPLTDFGTIQFTNANATTTDNHTGTITNAAFTPTELSLSSAATPLGPPAPPPPPPSPQATSPEPAPPIPSGAGATPTHPSRNGRAFAVKFTPGTQPAPSPTTTLPASHG